VESRDSRFAIQDLGFKLVNRKLKVENQLPCWPEACRSRQVPFQLKTIGVDLKRRRLKLELSQAELAQQLNVRVETIQNWGYSRTIPAVCHLSKLIEFLGYDPLENGKKAN